MEPERQELTADQIWQKSDDLWNKSANRRARYSALGVRYFQDTFLEEGLVATLQSYGIHLDSIPAFAIGRAHVDAAVAKISGTNKPRVQFMATSSNWRQRRAITKLEQFSIGVFSSRCEQFQDLWALRRVTARDALMFGDGFERVYFDNELGRATFGRVFPWEVLVDPEDAYTGNPTCLFHRYSMAVCDAVAMVRGREKDLVRGSARPTMNDRPWIPGLELWGIEQFEHQILVTEYWERKSGSEPGRHLLIAHGSGIVLLEEEWNHNWFPFNKFSWVQPAVGYFGGSLMEQSKRLESWVNEVIQRIVENTRACANNILLYEKGTISDPEKAFASPGSPVAFGYERGKTPPQLQTPAPFNPQLFQIIDTFFSRSFELTGVNQMSATAQKQPGIEANSAIQTMVDLQSERFSVQWNDYQEGYPLLAKVAVVLTKENIGSRKVRVSVPGDKFLNSVEWPSIDLDEDMFSVQLQPAPTSRWTLAGRIQQAENLGQSGVLSPESVVRVQRWGDTVSELDLSSKQDEYILRMIERWLDSDEEQRDTNLLRPNDEESPLLVPAIERAVDVPRAVSLVAPAYLEALFDEVPDGILALFLRWLANADEELAKQAPPAPPAPPGAEQPQQPPSVPMQ